MATARLIASASSGSSNSYVTITNPSNMYYNTDHTTNYATLRGRTRNNSTTYYAFINGFNFNSIPSGATVTSFSVKIRCYRNSYQNTGADYRIRLGSSASISSAIANTTMSSDIGTTVNTYTIPTGNLTWSQIYNYGSDFTVIVPLRNTSTSRNQYPYVYVYGVEIEVTYTEGGGSSEKIFVKNNGTWTQYSKVYKKVNGSWVEQAASTWSTLFNTSTNYRKMT